MRFRDRDLDPRVAGTTEADPNQGDAPAGAEEEARRRAAQLLELGDQVIERAMSGDSRQFLSDNRQQGGQ